jgi:hypothetical protein
MMAYLWPLFMRINPSVLLNHLKARQPDYVFVDIFDTLVRRTVHPDDTKRLASINLARALGGGVYSDLLMRVRAITERQMCLVNGELHGELEFSFDEFPKNYYKNIKLVMPWITIDESSFYDICISIELQAETSVLRRDDEICDALLAYRPDAKAIVAVSDFYLPQSYLLKLLEYLKVREIFDHLYVSCDFMKTKRSGNLYRYVLHDLGIDPARVIMVGDNAHSDGSMAQANQISSLVLDRTERLRGYEVTRKKLGTVNAAKAIYADYTRQDIDETEPRKLFDDFAPTLYLFMRRLHKACVCNQIDRLYFLSREGQFLRRVFDAYQNAAGILPSQRVATEYLFVSRRSTFPATLRSLSNESFQTLFRQYRKLSARMFLSSMGWDRPDIEKLSQVIEIELDFLENDFPSSDTFRRLLASEYFAEVYELKRVSGQSLITRYLDAVRRNDQGRMVLVDVGWKGTIQDHLRHALPDEVSLHGYYIGMSAPGLIKPGNVKTPLLFSYGCKLAEFNTTFGSVHALYEALMVANHGSVSSYSEKEGLVQPVFDERPEEQENYRLHAAPIQARLLELVKAVARNPFFQALSDSTLESLAEELFMRIVEKPTAAELDWYSSQQFYENFGMMEFRALACPSTTGGLFANIRYLLDPLPFEGQAGEWKTAHLHQLGLGPALGLKALLARVKGGVRTGRLQKTIVELTNKLQEHAVGLDRMTTMILDRESEARGAFNLAVKRFEIMQQMDGAIEARDAAIRANNAEITELRAALDSTRKMIDERDKAIAIHARMIEDQRSKLNQIGRKRK